MKMRKGREEEERGRRADEKKSCSKDKISFRQILQTEMWNCETNFMM